jgi:hypothetical protein
MDNDEKRRMGTLALWMDGDPAEAPSLAIPINLSTTLDLDQGYAFMVKFCSLTISILNIYRGCAH